MSRQKGPCLAAGRLGKAVDIMVTVALGMGDANEGAKREVLLHAEPGLTGQVLARYEVPFVFRAPDRRTRRIDNRLVDALAGFGRDAAVTEFARRRESVIAIVGLVDDEIADCQRAQWRL